MDGNQGAPATAGESKSRMRLLHTMIRVKDLEASLDFPEEGYDFVGQDEAAGLLAQVSAQVGSLLASSRAGRVLREGRTLVASLTQWALVDRETGKLARVPVEVAAPFLGDDTAQKEIE